ncbi:MAG: DUF2207 family protein [Clostridia bacterium]
MQKIKKINLFINIIFVLYLFVSVVINSANMLEDSNINIKCLWSQEECEKYYQEEYNNMTKEERESLGLKPVEQMEKEEVKEMVNEGLITVFLLVLLISIFFTLFQNAIIIIIFILVKIGNKKFKKEKLDSIDLRKTKEYYRDILQGYNILELSWVDNFEIDLEKDVIAELVQLESNNIISLNKEKLTVNKNYNQEKLKYSQKYILEHIQDGKLMNINKIELERKIKEDAIIDNLIEEKNDLRKRKIKKIIRSIILFIIMMFSERYIFNIIPEGKVENPLIIITIILLYTILALLSLFYPVISAISIIIYTVKYKLDPYFRTEKGKEINKKIEGLKSYLKNYSLLHEKERESVQIWEDYLAYSVWFEQNKIIIQQYKNYIEY